MELTQLTYFQMVARLEHMTRAAEALHIAQPALTKSIQKLENELGVPLIKRKGRGIVLTAYGQRLSEELEQPLAQLARLPDVLRQMSRESERTLHIRVLGASDVVMNFVMDYNKAHPDCHYYVFRAETGTDDDVLVDTDDGVSDSEAAGDLWEPILLAAPAGSALAQRSILSLRELKNELFVGLPANRRFRSFCDRLCRKHGITPRTAYECDNPEGVRRLVALGCGVALWPKHTWGGPMDGITLVPLSEPDCGRRLKVLCVTASRERRALAEEFCQALTDYLTSCLHPQGASQQKLL